MKANDLTLGGILTAISIIFLYLASILESNTLTFLTLASFMVPIGLMRGNLKTGFLIYASSSLLAFFMLPLNTALLYSLFFGIYGLVKYFIEKTRHLTIEIPLKLIFFNIIFFIVSFLMQNLLGLNVFSKLNTIIANHLTLNSQISSLALIWLIAQIAFMIFDYALTLLIDYYQRHLSRF